MTHGRDKREWEVTPEGRVWPCCFWSNAWDRRYDPDTKIDTGLLLGDEKLQKLMEDDPLWNSLTKHSFDDIVAHEYYNEDIYYPGWESDNPHPLCVKECSVVFDEDRGHERGNWDIKIIKDD